MVFMVDPQAAVGSSKYPNSCGFKGRPRKRYSPFGDHRPGQGLYWDSWGLAKRGRALVVSILCSPFPTHR